MLPRRSSMAKARRKRRSYSESKRTEVMAAAQKEGLTAAQVQKRFGVTPVTYYSWRKKYGAARRRGGLVAARARGIRARANGDITQRVRVEVQSKVREIVAARGDNEGRGYLNQMFGAKGGGRPQKV